MAAAKTTDLERQVLGVLLAEYRRAVRARGQLTIIVDPYLAGVGVHIFASPNTQGRTYTIERPEPKRRRTHGTRTRRR